LKSGQDIYEGQDIDIVLKSGFGIYEGQDSRFIEIIIGQYRDHAGYGVYEGEDWVPMY